MIAFIINLFFIIRKVPSAVGIIKMILDIVGSEAVKTLLESIRDVTQKLQKEQPTSIPIGELPPPERKRIVDRLKMRIAQRLLNLSDYQFAQTMTECGTPIELGNA